jgi:hypothetical protein
MKATHLTAYGNRAQDLRLVEVSEPETPSAGVAGRGMPVFDSVNPSGSIG